MSGPPKIRDNNPEPQLRSYTERDFAAMEREEQREEQRAQRERCRRRDTAMPDETPTLTDFIEAHAEIDPRPFFEHALIGDEYYFRSYPALRLLFDWHRKLSTKATRAQQNTLANLIERKREIAAASNYEYVVLWHGGDDVERGRVVKEAIIRGKARLQ
jgi:hypothetical protein